MVRNNRWIAIASVAGLLLGGPLYSQEPAQRESLTIGPGDQVHISVFDVAELDQHTKVNDSGNVKLILGGEVHIGGDSPTEAARTIEGALRVGNYVLAPHVSVSVERYATETVSVLGSVKSPSTYSLDTARSIVDVLAMSGGLAEGASRRITIRRKDTGEKISYLFSNSPDAALDNAPLVYPGDTVFVPHADIVYMIGDLNRPGAYANTTDGPTITVLQILALAGSTPPTAVPSKSKLIRKLPDGGYEVRDVDISQIMKGKRPDFVLQPNDVIYVPFSYLKNAAVNLGAILASAASASLYQF
jgi:polysaccharide export outer membrane protein